METLAPILAQITTAGFVSIALILMGVLHWSLKGFNYIAMAFIIAGMFLALLYRPF